MQQGEARFDLLVQIDRLPHLVLPAGEHPEVPHDLPAPLGALPDPLDHRVEVPERVVHLQGFPALLHGRPRRLRQRCGLEDVQHGAQAGDEILQHPDVGIDEPDGIVQLVGDPGHQLTDRGHLLALDELHLRGLQLAVGAGQLLVGRPQLLGAHADLVLQARGSGPRWSGSSRRGRRPGRRCWPPRPGGPRRRRRSDWARWPRRRARRRPGAHPQGHRDQ